MTELEEKVLRTIEESTVQYKAKWFGLHFLTKKVGFTQDKVWEAVEVLVGHGLLVTENGFAGLP
jgi:hypothetical protein